MSLVGHILGIASLDETCAPDPELAELIRIQREMEHDAALEYFFEATDALSAMIAEQYSADHEQVRRHLEAMPTADVRQLAHVFGWVWLAHDAARAMGISNPPLLKIAFH